MMSSSAFISTRGLRARPLPRVCYILITGENNNENANEQIGDISIQESFASQNGLYKLTCQ